MFHPCCIALLLIVSFDFHPVLYHSFTSFYAPLSSQWCLQEGKIILRGRDSHAVSECTII
jgi:hypothetical protein